MFEIGTKVQFKLKILNFRTKLTQKGYLRSKNGGKQNHYQVIHVQISLGFKVQPQQF